MRTAPAGRFREQSAEPAVHQTAQLAARAGSRVAVYVGNLAPAGCVSRGPDSVSAGWRGSASVFDTLAAAQAAIEAGRIQPGDIIVLRYQDPGDQESRAGLDAICRLLHQQGLEQQVLCISDGVFPADYAGAVVEHVMPTAETGGPLALVEGADVIAVDGNRKRLSLVHSDETIAARRLRWRPRLNHGVAEQDP